MTSVYSELRELARHENAHARGTKQQHTHRTCMAPSPSNKRIYGGSQILLELYRHTSPSVLRGTLHTSAWVAGLLMSIQSLAALSLISPSMKLPTSNYFRRNGGACMATGGRGTERWAEGEKTREVDIGIVYSSFVAHEAGNGQERESEAEQSDLRAKQSTMQGMPFAADSLHQARRYSERFSARVTFSPAQESFG